MLSRKRHCLWVCPLERVKADLDCLLWSENGISMQISTLPWLGCPCLQANMDKGISLGIFLLIRYISADQANSFAVACRKCLFIRFRSFHRQTKLSVSTPIKQQKNRRVESEYSVVKKIALIAADRKITTQGARPHQ